MMPQLEEKFKKTVCEPDKLLILSVTEELSEDMPMFVFNSFSVHKHSGGGDAVTDASESIGTSHGKSIDMSQHT